MGLAAYGNRKKFSKISVYSQSKNGWFFNNFDSTGYLSDRLERFCKRRELNIPEKFSNNHFKKYKDLAAWIQYEFERAIIGTVEKLLEITKVNNLCLSGGGALNGIANYKILKSTEIKNLHIFPAANDSGQGVGNALYGYYIFGKNERKKESCWSNDFKGRVYKNSEIKKYLKNRIGFKDDVIPGARKYELKEYRKNRIPKIIAKLISKGHIIGWFQGGSELGPRALGHRSIICDPRKKEMKQILNLNVKSREGFRPYAASVLLKNANDYFDISVPSMFMLLVSKIKPEKIADVSAVVHVDGTCRVQTLTHRENGIYYDLVKSFYEITGVPLVLNTSFNIAGEPMVETPSDAVRCFLKTKIDYLVIHNYVLKKCAYY
jgi:carbamoyltransferase